MPIDWLRGIQKGLIEVKQHGVFAIIEVSCAIKKVRYESMKGYSVKTIT